VSPLFQVTVDSEVYATMLRSLKAMAEKVDGCSDFTRVLVWTQLFSLVGCALSNSKRLSQIIQIWTAEDAVNVLGMYVWMTCMPDVRVVLRGNVTKVSTFSG
jgi:uncharacterized membrane protein